MSRKDSRVDAYISSSPAFAQPILRHLREVFHRGCPELEETVKWGKPAFVHHGMICLMSAFKEHCSVAFWRPEVRALIFGPEGDKDGMGEFGRLTAVKDLPADSKIVGWVKASAELNAGGIKRPEPKRAPKPPVEVPDYLEKALKKAPAAKKHFAEFTPSKRREYVEWLVEAKTEATREKRLATAVEWLAEGKSRHWKYQNC